jgi:glycosyltransferase involved in cell wall biosynthesis
MRPKFSIVTSFFGEDPSYVYRLYECVKAQSVDWEWVVTDDFSDNPETLKSLIEISRFDKRVRRIAQTEKREIFRNPSLYARGEFIFHVDGDDQFHPLYLEHCQIWFDRLPDVVCILCGSRGESPEGYFYNFFLHNSFSDSPNPSYLGRVWRSSFKIDLEPIFEDANEIIRMNDMFIVKYLETKGDILCLPRVYVKYEIRKTSNSHRERSGEEVRIIEKARSEFFNWYSLNKPTLLPYSSYFYIDPSEGIESDFFPFTHLNWNCKSKNLWVVGFPNSVPKRRLLLQLHPDFCINFTEDLASVPEGDLVFIDARGGKRIPLFGRNFLIFTEDESTRGYYSSAISSKSILFMTTHLHRFSWLDTSC